MKGSPWPGFFSSARIPTASFPHAGIDAVALPGTEMDYNARERGRLRGPMTPLLDRDGKIVENGLVEQAVEFVKRNTKVDTVLEDGVRRQERWTYPEEVLRETIVNALIHRDYLMMSTDIQLALYSDRLEIASPGRLPNGITPARMRTGCRGRQEPTAQGHHARLPVSGAHGYGHPPQGDSRNEEP
jgi:ATP-dependent DNA helicase RecG